MGMRALESAILQELRKVENDQSIRKKDIMEWVLGDKLSEPIRAGEKEVHLTIFGDQPVAVAYIPKKRKK